jgi:6-phosphogluconate dehydrogenase (decarboxylating)
VEYLAALSAVVRALLICLQVKALIRGDSSLLLHALCKMVNASGSLLWKLNELLITEVPVDVFSSALTIFGGCPS